MIDTFQRIEAAGPANRGVAFHNSSDHRDEGTYSITHPAIPVLQKKSLEEEELQLKAVAQFEKPEEEELQMVPIKQLKDVKKGLLIQKKEDTSSILPNYTGIPDHLKTGIENLSGFSMDDVKVHYNSGKPAQLNALAYAQGTDIHIAPGQERHLPHEAWHVVQQKQRRVKPTIQMKTGVNVNDDRGLEKEADIMGAMALKRPVQRQTKQLVADNSTATDIVQRRELTGQERKLLKQYVVTAGEIEEEYNITKEGIKSLESIVICSAHELEELHLKITECFTYYDNYFSKLKEKRRGAHLSDKIYKSFKGLLNHYTHSGGKNKLLNLKIYMKGLTKDKTKVIIPSVMRFSDYLSLISALHKQVGVQCKKTSPMPDIQKVKTDLESLITKVNENTEDDWESINTLHHKISRDLGAYPDWNSAIKKQFIELKLIDSKKKVKKELLEDIGSINVASRSDKSEGYYMRSQNVHKMHIGSDEVTPFVERTGKYLEEGAKVYNIGGAKMTSDTVMVQKNLRRGRKKVSSKNVEGLRDDILEHKNTYVKFIADNFGGDMEHLKAPKKQLDAKYPCVLVLFKEELMKKVSSSQDNIPEFLTHLIAGHINAALIKGSLRPLVDRRQSFGFMTPTITDVHSGVRLSLGVTPSEEWCHAVIAGIKSADDDIESYDGFKSVPGDSKDKDPDFVIMNKFNQGSVLGAGHKLITEKLLSGDNKTSITQSEINELFGTRQGLDVVKDILKIDKPEFDAQAVDVKEDSAALYNRLKSFYEQFIKISGGSVKKEEVDWNKTDPGEKLQKLMDKAVKAVYDDSKNVVDLDESSDEEGREPSRVPSGMSALFLPIASYSSIHEDSSIIYDTAPFSYFEIDGSWKRTFKLDYIERLGVRYPLVTPRFEKEALENLEMAKKEEIVRTTIPHYQKIEEIEAQGNLDEEKVRDQFRLTQSQMNPQRKQLEANKVEKKIEKINNRVRTTIDQKKVRINNLTEKQNGLFNKQEIVLKKQLEECSTLMNSYMECQEINPQTNKPKMPKKLKKVLRDLNMLMAKLKKSTKEGNPARFVARSILDAFEKCGFGEMDKAVRAKSTGNVEVAFVDVNPCMTSEDEFDSGANLFHQTMQKYDKLRMIVVDITSCTEKQVNETLTLFQNQTVDRNTKKTVPFLCLAKSGTKHDQLGLDISTMGRCSYIMHNSFKDDERMQKEFRNLNSASRSLSSNTEPVLVKKLRRDLRKAAQKSED